MGYEMGNNNSTGLQEENNTRTEADEISKQEDHLLLTDNETNETGFASDKPRLAENPDASDFQAKEGTEVYFPVGSPKIEIKSNEADAEESKTKEGTEVHFPVESPKSDVKSIESYAEESKTEPFSLSETSEVGTEPEITEGHAPVASQIVEFGINKIQPISSFEDFKEQEKLLEPITNEDQSEQEDTKPDNSPTQFSEESAKTEKGNVHQSVTTEEQESLREDFVPEHSTNYTAENIIVSLADFGIGKTAIDYAYEETDPMEVTDVNLEPILEIDRYEAEEFSNESNPNNLNSHIQMRNSVVESQTEQEDTPIQFTDDSANGSKTKKGNADKSATTEIDPDQGNSKNKNVADTEVAENGFLDNTSDKYQTESSVDPEGEFLTSDEPGPMIAELSVTNCKPDANFEEHCKISGETMVVREESGIVPLELVMLEKDEPTEKNIFDDTAQSKPNSVEQGQVFRPVCPVSLVQSGNCETVSLPDFGNEKTAKDQTEYEQTDPTEIITRANNLHILDTDQCAGRFSNESNPNNLNSHIQMRKSPSFGLDLRIKARSEETDQTPLLYQDKAAIEDKSNQIDITFDNQVVHTRVDQGQLKYGAMPVEEKVITLGKSDSEKHKRRFSLFGTCLCCTTEIN